MPDQFKIGDVVILKGGGEFMTVVAIDGEDIAVAWHSGGKQQHAEYPAAALRKDEPFHQEL
jgi:uncharacterized protein YodC (DUF2158 family)